jgi:hypothetical protein
MRLSCNLLLNNGPGKESTFITAGTAIPDHMVPPHARQYRISEREGRQLEKELAEWRAIVAERREKAKREAAEKKQRGAAGASKA